MKCFACGGVGHLSRDCPNSSTTEKVCYKCQMPGHIQAQCPQKNGTGEINNDMPIPDAAAAPAVAAPIAPIAAPIVPGA